MTECKYKSEDLYHALLFEYSSVICESGSSDGDGILMADWENILHEEDVNETAAPALGSNDISVLNDIVKVHDVKALPRGNQLSCGRERVDRRIGGGYQASVMTSSTQASEKESKSNDSWRRNLGCAHHPKTTTQQLTGSICTVECTLNVDATIKQAGISTAIKASSNENKNSTASLWCRQMESTQQSVC